MVLFTKIVFNWDSQYNSPYFQLHNSVLLLISFHTFNLKLSTFLFIIRFQYCSGVNHSFIQSMIAHSLLDSVNTHTKTLQLILSKYLTHYLIVLFKFIGIRFSSITKTNTIERKRRKTKQCSDCVYCWHFV